MEISDELYETYSELIKIKGECSCKLIDELNMSELTLRQIEYIKKFDRCDYVTTSELAKILELSKPSVTEMIKKFIKLECIYKQKCNEDGRVYYLHLTEKGRCIARFEELTVRKLVDRILDSLEEDEIKTLISLLSKIK
ncbi:DNA-binding transcriptional regulator, MarR family [Clostridium acidisoli DSM 12555]|uniref:DNA-binding transcriptional regulator, MarR family n=1 Tax=Clostridium acidisoli DSM 12555 TaxID=1121291 RepID=A0A1W1XE28_9CLOT|nr:MarR family transcriptional regulator [Clostridium acidisoli]SMC22295.1 DNA-binding transcriptional regulator, MarR family [Clostridium acidisoli DSM 12555]